MAISAYGLNPQASAVTVFFNASVKSNSHAFHAETTGPPLLSEGYHNHTAEAIPLYHIYSPSYYFLAKNDMMPFWPAGFFPPAVDFFAAGLAGLAEGFLGAALLWGAGLGFCSWLLGFASPSSSSCTPPAQNET